MLHLLKVLLLAVSSWLYVEVIMPPKVAKAKGENTVYRGQIFEYMFRSMAYLGCLGFAASSLCHAIIIMTYEDGTAPKEIVSRVCPVVPPTLYPLVSYSARFIAGVAFVVAGSLLRLLSFRTLGRLFTFEVIIKDNHQLITTGLYRYVRHPSYTGLLMVVIGTYLIHFGPGGYVTQCGIDSTHLAIVVNLWRMGSLYTFVGLYKRCKVEDAQLREQFGTVWTTYREQVPYCLMPFVF